MIDKTPSDYQGRMHQLLDQILEADSQQEASRRLEEVSSELEDEAEDALDVLEEGIFDATAVLALPEKYRERLRMTNMVERLIQEIRRREKVIRIFPNQASAWRLVGALMAENMKNGPPDGVTGRWRILPVARGADRRTHQRPATRIIQSYPSTSLTDSALYTKNLTLSNLTLSRVTSRFSGASQLITLLGSFN